MIQNGEARPVHLLWIAEHGEKRVRQGQEEQLQFMKVKMFHPDSGLFFWVMVDDQSKPVIFERGILWDYEAALRVTQMPLHDGRLEVMRLDEARSAASAPPVFFKRQRIIQQSHHASGRRVPQAVRLLHHGAQVKNRQVNRKHQASYKHSHDQHQTRLQFLCELCQLLVECLFFCACHRKKSVVGMCVVLT